MGKYKVEITGVNTSNLATLTSSEMRELFKRLKEKDEFARDLLIEGNLRLVLSILKRFYKRGENLDDLFQVGCIGLVKSIDNFDLSYNVQFSTYAVPMITGEIKRYIRDNSTLRISRSLKDIYYKSVRLSEEYYLENGVYPSTSYIADRLGVAEYLVVLASEAMREPVSMYEAIYSDGGDTIYLYDQIEDRCENIDVPLKLSVEEARKVLDDRENLILDERYVQGKTQMEVASELNISQAQVSRLEAGAIKSLKKVLK